MKRKELAQRNLVSTIADCLKEHQVNLNGTTPFYLIQVETAGNPMKDLTETYTGEVIGFKKQLAEKVFGNSDMIVQQYGVLIDPELNYAFAFNMKFADLDRKKEHIVFKKLDDVLLANTESSSESGTGLHESLGPASTLIRYALIGKKKPTSGKKGDVEFERPSLLNRVQKLYAGNKIQLNVGSITETFYLVRVSYDTSRLDDFMKTYGDEVDEFKAKLAKKVFGDKKVYNDYRMLLSEDMQIVYAFNTKFAWYDGKTKSIKYLPVEEALLGDTKKDLAKGGQKPVLRSRPLIPGRRSYGDRAPTTFKYSILGK